MPKKSDALNGSLTEEQQSALRDAYCDKGPLCFVPNKRALGVTQSQIETHGHLLRALFTECPGPAPAKTVLRGIVKRADDLSRGKQAKGCMSRGNAGSEEQLDFCRREADALYKMWRHCWLSYLRWPDAGKTELMSGLKDLLAGSKVVVKSPRKSTQKKMYVLCCSPNDKTRDPCTSPPTSFASSPESLPEEPSNLDELHSEKPAPQRWRRLRQRVIQPAKKAGKIMKRSKKAAGTTKVGKMFIRKFCGKLVKKTDRLAIKQIVTEFTKQCAPEARDAYTNINARYQVQTITNKFYQVHANTLNSQGKTDRISLAICNCSHFGNEGAFMCAAVLYCCAKRGFSKGQLTKFKGLLKP